MPIVFATHNQGKVKEVNSMFDGVKFVSALAAGVTEEVEEDGETLEENALKKARYAARITGMQAIADDTGLFIDSLGGQPGIHAARWAGENSSDDDKLKKVLHELKGSTGEERNAYFESVVAYVDSGKEERVFFGRLNGQIALQPLGKPRPKLPYDLVFVAQGHKRTLAQMSDKEKNALSHRGLAFKKLIKFLDERNHINTVPVPINIYKRTFDIVASVLLLTFMAPIYAAIILGIFINNLFCLKPGADIFYSEYRISQGKPFIFIKFNIFYPGVVNEARKNSKIVHTKELEHSPGAMTWFGSLLQHVYMDELPQLINILKGDLSFVGPRPVNLEVYDNMIKKGILVKSIVRAGLTGPYQANKGMPGKKANELDAEYIEFCRTNSGLKILAHDLAIIAATIKTVIRAEGL